MKICLLHCNNISFRERKYLSCTWALLLKLHLATFSQLRKKLFSIRGLGFSSSFLVALNTALVFLEALKPVILCIEALTWLALQKSSNTSKSFFYIANNIHFMRKKHISWYLSLLLKLHLATFSHWERSFSASLALHSLHLLSCTKHSISVLSSNILVFLALKKSSKHQNLASALQITFHFMRKKETSFMYLSVTLKIAFSNFLSLRKKLFSICGLAFSSFS